MPSPPTNSAYISTLDLPWRPLQLHPSTSYQAKQRAAMHTGLLLSLAAPAVVSAQLHDLALAAGLDFFGAAIGEGNTNDSEYMAIASDTSEIGQLTPENGQKWDATEPNR